MINQYRLNNSKFKKRTSTFKDNAIYNSLQKGLIITEDELKFKKDSSPRKRVVSKLIKPETEYETKVK